MRRQVRACGIGRAAACAAAAALLGGCSWIGIISDAIDWVGDELDGEDDGEAFGTSLVEVVMNLDAGASATTMDFDPVDPSSYGFSAAVEVCDRAGEPRPLTLYFVCVGDDTWEYHVVVESGEVGLPAGSPILLDTDVNSLLFDPAGSLEEELGGTVTIPFAGADPLEVAFDFGKSLAEGGLGYDGATQFADRPYLLQSYEADGCGE